MTEPTIIIHASQECKNPPKQVFFKRFQFKEPVTCHEGEELEIEWDLDAGTASAKGLKTSDDRLQSRKERLEGHKTCLLFNTSGLLDPESKLLFDKWEFEIAKLEYILNEK
jgi:hypothetical protein